MIWALCLYFFVVSIFMSAAQTVAAAGGIVIFYVAFYCAVHVAPEEINSILGEHHILSVNSLASLSNMFTGAMQVFNAVQRDPIDKKIILSFVPTCLISLPLGVALLVYVNIRPVKLILASTLVVVAVIQGFLLLYNPPTEFRTVLKRKHYIAISITGIFSGFLQGAFGIGGPPRMLFMMWSRLCKSRARASFLISMYMLSFIKLVLLFSAGKIAFVTWQPYCLLASVILGAVPGICLGNMLHARINPAQMNGFMLTMLIAGATMMFDPPTIVLEAVILVLFLIVFGIFCYNKRLAIQKLLRRNPSCVATENNLTEV
ncbi:permease [Perkinsela sp. CCAP 1560/4]|nr:permease [Perkinsela sp. CCAP 1560/4]|eukprot:KNH04447.1 permease [Perkinsela sp. CCAP 1560/4]